MDVRNGGVEGQPFDEDGVVDCFQLSGIVPTGEQIHFQFQEAYEDDVEEYGNKKEG